MSPLQLLHSMYQLTAYCWYNALELLAKRMCMLKAVQLIPVFAYRMQMHDVAMSDDGLRPTQRVSCDSCLYCKG